VVLKWFKREVHFEPHTVEKVQTRFKEIYSYIIMLNYNFMILNLLNLKYANLSLASTSFMRDAPARARAAQ